MRIDVTKLLYKFHSSSSYGILVIRTSNDSRARCKHQAIIPIENHWHLMCISLYWLYYWPCQSIPLDLLFAFQNNYMCEMEQTNFFVIKTFNPYFLSLKSQIINAYDFGKIKGRQCMAKIFWSRELVTLINLN